MEQRSFRVLSGSTLKLLAVLTMLIDHGAICLAARLNIPLLPGGSLTLYTLMRGVGRLSFPLFSFLLTEGFRHTRNRLRYGLNLLIFALLSELPFNLLIGGALFYAKQNVFFTLLLGYLGIWAAESFREDRKKQLPLLLGLFVIAFLLRADYGWKGFCFILLLYYLGEFPAVQALGCSALLPWPYAVGLAFLPINLYNGRRGFVRGPVLKYLFYAFYPAHLLLLWLLRRSLLGA